MTRKRPAWLLPLLLSIIPGARAQIQDPVAHARDLLERTAIPLKMEILRSGKRPDPVKAKGMVATLQEIHGELALAHFPFTADDVVPRFNRLVVDCMFISTDSNEVRAVKRRQHRPVEMILTPGSSSSRLRGSCVNRPGNGFWIPQGQVRPSSSRGRLIGMKME